ncbi:helix-turn-helix domain-containing protein [uncultured Amaricoccus sp.]|uniref:helix-turn-helix domain-containing protein n=1 Tax=uncultured Amaricoccus sp. TaxID=339341 RepID=UPI00260E676E|nr:helix-turn-helix domain-containing protein [uncultured Amaricoccus sp.]
MSVQAITWALDFRVRSATEKAILLVLANYANEYGISWPSQPTLADQSACTDRTVRSVLQRLEGRGVVRRVPRRRGNGSRQSDIILLAAFVGRKPIPPGLIEEDEQEPISQAEEFSGCAPNRKHFPGGNRKGFPHPPEAVSALDPSLILKDSAHNAAPNSHLACLAVAGPGLDKRERGPLALSAQEIDRWLRAGCDLIGDILPVIAAKSAGPRDQPIRSWAYFTAAILDAKARREAPLSPREENRNEQDRRPRRPAQRGRAAARGFGDAWDAAIAELDAEGSTPGTAVAGGPRPDRPDGGGAECRVDAGDSAADRRPD